ncbi:glycosyltransferase (plasmid) [Phyllobacterium sp. 628]|uniref:glycosyltransferase family 4 protein n=1 Tax=Phyllobacterium sp. 628 TaxID=2718938 RepID=UPI0016626FB1|nr:glycosyltransferase [Phyllobacterium sp. 628]QND50594.1 glycosyltransferase [Phyllobacterium sp. 628]
MRSELLASPYTLDENMTDLKVLLGKFAGKRVFFDGVFKGDYSLAIVNRFLAQALIATGIDIVCYTSESDWQTDARISAAPEVKRRMLPQYPAGQTFDVHLRNTWPPVTHDMVGKFNAYVNFAWEELEVPQYLVSRFNRDLDLVMVTANFVKQAFVQSGLTIPVEVVGNGTDHVHADSGVGAVSPLPSNGKKRILHVSSCFPRKGIDVLIEAYAQTFKQDEPVELVIKTFPNPDNILRKVMTKFEGALKDAPPVILIEDYCDPDELLALYRTAALVVAPSRGEGFGLPLAEAMRLGVPVVTTGYSGQVDFCTPRTAWLVDYHMAPSLAHVSGSLSLWAEPSVADLGKQMRAALSNQEEARMRSKNALKLLDDHMSWQAVAGRVLSAIAKPVKLIAGFKRPWTIDLVSSWQQQCGLATYSGHLFSTPALAGRFSHIYARRIVDDALPDSAAEKTAETAAITTRPWGYDLASLTRFIGEIEQARGDVVWIQHHPGHFSTPDMELLLSTLQHTSHKLRIITMHSVKETLRGGHLEWTKAFDVVFVHSAEDAGLLANAGHPNPVVVPHGVRESLDNGPQPEPSTFTIGSFGFLMPHKNIDLLVRAFAKARLFEPRLRLKLLNCMVPNDQSRASRVTVENLLNYFDLHDVASARFDFVDEAELSDELARCDLLAFLYGASTETATGAARIAMTADRPLLCSRSSVLRDMWPISHVVRSVDVDCVAEALVSLAQNLALLGLRDADRRQATEWNSYPRVAARHVVVIEQMLGRKYDNRRAA